MDLMKMDFAKFEARVMANTCAATRRARRRRILREIAAVLLYAGLCALLTFLATSCAWFEDKRVIIPRPTRLVKIDRSSQEYQDTIIMLYAKIRHPEWTIKELRAEVEYQKYLRERSHDDEVEDKTRTVRRDLRMAKDEPRQDPKN